MKSNIIHYTRGEKMLFNTNRKKPSNYSEAELSIIDLICSFDFPYNHVLHQQILSARVERETSPFYYLLFLSVDISQEPIPGYIGTLSTPIDIQVEFIDEVPIEILVHVADGYIKEIEIYRLDSKAFSLKDIFQGKAVFGYEFDEVKIKKVINEIPIHVASIQYRMKDSITNLFLIFDNDLSGYKSLQCMDCDQVLANQIINGNHTNLSIENSGDGWTLKSTDNTLYIHCKHTILLKYYG